MIQTKLVADDKNLVLNERILMVHHLFLMCLFFMPLNKSKKKTDNKTFLSNNTAFQPQLFVQVSPFEDQILIRIIGGRLCLP